MVEPTGLRNRIAHGYWSVALDALCATATDDLPGFVTALRAVLADIERTQTK